MLATEYHYDCAACSALFKIAIFIWDFKKARKFNCYQASQEQQRNQDQKIKKRLQETYEGPKM